MTRRFCLSFLIACCLFAGLMAEKVALVGGKIYPVSSAPVENGVLLIDGDVIADVGVGLAIPSGYRRVDVSGHSVFPGLINAYTVLGLREYGGLVASSVDTDEGSDPVTPQLRVTDGFHLDSRNIPVVRRYGVTQALTTPGENNVFAGQSAFVSLGGGRLPQVVLKSPVASHINLGEPARSVYGSRNKMPMTRMGVAALVRQTLIKAREYSDKKQKDSSHPSDYKLDSLVPVIRGELPVIVRAKRLDDILTALRIREEFGLRMILSHATDAYKVADRLAKEKITVLLGPVTTQPASLETRGAIYENAARLSKAGVKFAIITGGSQQAGRLPYEAGIAAAYGLDRDEALKSLTLYPAEILGVSERYGSLEKGKTASVVVADGLLLQPRSRVKKLFIEGVEIDLRTWQEDLYDRYK